MSSGERSGITRFFRPRRRALRARRLHRGIVESAIICYNMLQPAYLDRAYLLSKGRIEWDSGRASRKNSRRCNPRPRRSCRAATNPAGAAAKRSTNTAITKATKHESGGNSRPPEAALQKGEAPSDEVSSPPIRPTTGAPHHSIRLAMSRLMRGVARVK